MPRTKEKRVVFASDRDHPAHTEEFRRRIDALAKYFGNGDYNLDRKWWRYRLRCKKLWSEAYDRYRYILRDPDFWWWYAPNEVYLLNPPGSEPLTSAKPDAALI
jgi:hypothetical protein